MKNLLILLILVGTSAAYAADYPMKVGDTVILNGKTWSKNWTRGDVPVPGHPNLTVGNAYDQGILIYITKRNPTDYEVGYVQKDNSGKEQLVPLAMNPDGTPAFLLPDRSTNPRYLDLYLKVSVAGPSSKPVTQRIHVTVDFKKEVGKYKIRPGSNFLTGLFVVNGVYEDRKMTFCDAQLSSL